MALHLLELAEDRNSGFRNRSRSGAKDKYIVKWVPTNTAQGSSLATELRASGRVRCSRRHSLRTSNSLSTASRARKPGLKAARI